MTSPTGFLQFGGRCVLVTGASSGLGRACAIELAIHGARVILVGRNVTTLAETRAAMNGDDHEVLELDLTDLDRVGTKILRVARAVGPMYGFCHAAGLVMTLPLHASSVAHLQSMMRVNVIAGLEMARILTRRDIMSTDGASLLFFSSVYAACGAAGQSAYSATKGAILSAARALAVELARRRVRVNTISPGLIRTPMTEAAFKTLSPEQVQEIERKHPLGPGTPSDVARAAVFLLAPATTWITGTNLVVDGGYSAQ
jgi:NAD(P)-dependent dehydrogenase (short-subunit alcohol dehydrogenase family)